MPPPTPRRQALESLGSIEMNSRTHGEPEPKTPLARALMHPMCTGSRANTRPSRTAHKTQNPPRLFKPDPQVHHLTDSWLLHSRSPS
jgi:hypothetical protein